MLWFVVQVLVEQQQGFLSVQESYSLGKQEVVFHAK